MALNTTIAGLESNSYVTVEFADTYIQANLEASTWLELTSSQKEQLLIKAALMLEDYKYSGDRTVLGQSLAFPRVNLYKYEDTTQPVAFNIIPYQIKHAQCELALWMFLSQGVDEYSSVNMAGLSVSKGLETDDRSSDIPEIVFILIKPFFKNIVNSAMISVTRAYVSPEEVATKASTISGVATFVGLLDTPNEYTDSEGKFVRVNDEGSALEFVDGISSGEMSWGNITGLISNQTDLQDELDAKLDSNPALASIINTGDGTQFLANDGTYKIVSGGSGSSAWGGITGTLSDQTDLENALNAKADTTALHSHADLAAVEKVIDSGDGTQFLANDGIYKTVSSGSGSVNWGGVLGTLSNQTDLQNALDAKADSSAVASSLSVKANVTDLHSHSNKTLLDSIVNNGDGTTFLASDGTYKTVTATSSGTVNWGDIEGTISEQIDLTYQLSLKANATDVHFHTDLAAVEKVIDSGDGTTFLASDGTYKTPPATWGSINGTITNQSDLQAILNNKANSSDIHTHNNKTLLDTITNVGNGTYFLSNDGTYKTIQNTSGVNFTAKDAITIGSWVALNDDNTVSLVVSTADGISKGSFYTYETSLATIRHSITALNATTFVVAVTGDTDASKLYVGTISNGSISFGSAYTIPGAFYTGWLRISALSDTAFIASYVDTGDSTKGAYVVGTVSGTTISFGTERNTAVTYTLSLYDVTALTSTSFAAVYRTSSELRVVVGTVSGTTITLGTPVTITSSSINEVQIKKLTSTSFVIKYLDSGPDGWCLVGTVSGTTITLYTASMFQDNYTYYSEMDVLSPTRIVCACRTGSTTSGSVYVGTIAPNNSITFSAASTIVASGDYRYQVVATSSSTAAIFYSSSAASAASVKIAYIGSSNTVTSYSAALSIGTCRHFSGILMNGKVSASFVDMSDSSKGKVVIIDPALMNVDRKIGIAQNTAAASASVTVVLTDGTLYTHPTGDGNLHVPATGTTNAGKVLTAGSIAGSLSWETPTGGSGTTADDSVYNASTWNGSLLAPTQNAVRDKIEVMEAEISSKASLTGTENLTNKTLTGVTETAITTLANAGTLTINCASGNLFSVNLDQNIVNITFTNLPTTGKVYGFTLKLVIGATPRIVTWPSSIKWSAGVAPTISDEPGVVDMFVIFTHNAGTTWYAFLAGKAME